ncbi:MAG: energy transducer TonB [Desulfuromonadaceae bacterium]|nr:energy transducer TonB [Desulfuromonadaceae bacterium]MDD5105130.1 energy transducer TonB [Desulfuromonadaceae bacterium]
MSSHASRIDAGCGVSFIFSAVMHLAVFLLILWWGELFPASSVVQQTYYVDVVNLPVLDPHTGDTAQPQGEADISPPPPAPLPMAAPVVSKTAQKVPIKQTAPRNTASAETEFMKRMAALERNADARHEEAALGKLRGKVSGTDAKAGSPTATGSAAGSRYADYIKSRLEDALKLTSSYSSKNPEVAARLTISGEGKLIRVKFERSSGDVSFELAVRRAIDLASEKFPAPPSHTVFENGFVFKPEKISSRSSR